MNLTTRLNTDCLEKIFEYLSPIDLINTSKACKRWNESSKKVQARWMILLNLKAEKMLSSPPYQGFQTRRSYVLNHLRNPTTKQYKTICESLTNLNSITLKPSALHKHLSKIEALKDLKVSDSLLKEEKEIFDNILRNAENDPIFVDPTTRVSTTHMFHNTEFELQIPIFFTYLGSKSVDEIESIISKDGANVNSVIFLNAQKLDLISAIITLSALEKNYKFDLINLLLKNGINRHSDASLSPLRVARMDINILRLLLENGFNAKATDSKGSMLNGLNHLTIKTAQLLIKYGADPFSFSKNVESPMEEARFKGKTALVELFASTRQKRKYCEMNTEGFSIENLPKTVNRIIRSILYKKPKYLVDG